MKKIVIILGAILLVGLVAAASFWGGMAYQTNKAERARANFIKDRGQPGGGQLPFDGQLPPDGQFPLEGQMPGGEQGAGFFGGRGTTGQVKTVDGNVMTLSTAQDVTTVHLSDATQIEETVVGSTSDLQPGVRVVVTGQEEKDGSFTASRIQILNENAALPPDRTPPGTEP